LFAREELPQRFVLIRSVLAVTDLQAESHVLELLEQVPEVRLDELSQRCCPSWLLWQIFIASWEGSTSAHRPVDAA
jgi:hypothetical protein